MIKITYELTFHRTLAMKVEYLLLQLAIIHIGFGILIIFVKDADLDLFAMLMLVRTEILLND